MKKYEKVFRQDYEKWYRENQAFRDQVAQDPRRLCFHLMPETGWLNDPNGLCQFQGLYHIYYQYCPFEPTGQLKLWGHTTTRDFIHFTREEPALYPDTDLDAHGAYSGSALVQDGMIHFFYTGNVKYFDRPDYDYIMNGRGSNTIHVASRDGFDLWDKELVLSRPDYPADMSAHIRDPKVFRDKDSFYMVLGARDRDSRGLILIYRSQDLRRWEYHGRLSTREPFGYMWECPDLFCLDGQRFLICCPQGVKPQGVDYQNVHQCTVMKVKGDIQEKTLEIEEDQKIQMLDRGFDFYAPQTFEDEKGRRILIGWMGIPDADYTNPTQEAGWQHALTIPRELKHENGFLIQKPLEELKGLRGRKMEGSMEDWKARSAQEENPGLVYEAVLEFEGCQAGRITLRQGVELIWEQGLLTLDLGQTGSGRTRRQVYLDELASLDIFSDTTSLEIFVNQGRQVFTTRVYGMDPAFRIQGDMKGSIQIYQMNSLVLE